MDGSMPITNIILYFVVCIYERLELATRNIFKTDSVIQFTFDDRWGHE